MWLVLMHATDFPDCKLSAIRLEERKPLGTFLEVSSSKEIRLSRHTHAAVKHLQTLGGKSSVKRYRFHVPEWTSLNHQIQQAHQSVREAERLAFKMVCEQLYLHRSEIHTAIKAVAELDVALSMATTAQENWYVLVAVGLMHVGKWCTL